MIFEHTYLLELLPYLFMAAGLVVLALLVFTSQD